MPEESSAAEEHAIIQEITAPLASLPDNPVSDAADANFPIVLRGYDRLAVDAYVKRTSQLMAELQSTRSPEAAVRRALERVGEEVSGILQRAHDAAAQITAQSRSDAEDRLERARQEAAQITVDARRRLKELDAETDRIWAERHRIVEDAQDLARQLLSLAEAAAERFPAADDLPEEDEAEAAAFPEGGIAPGLNGEEPVDEVGAEEPVFGGEPMFADEPGEPGEPMFADEPEEPPAGHANGERRADEFDGDVTQIMPPIVMPDDGEGS
jgi:hypothetical protein